MATKIRLARGGAKSRPYYRIVVADSRMPRDGRYIERLGSYNPMLPKDHEERVVVKNLERLQHWLSSGAQMTDRVQRLLSQIDGSGVEKPKWREQTKKSLQGDKMRERSEAKAEKQKEPEAAKEA